MSTRTSGWKCSAAATAAGLSGLFRRVMMMMMMVSRIDGITFHMAPLSFTPSSNPTLVVAAVSSSLHIHHSVAYMNIDTGVENSSLCRAATAGLVGSKLPIYNLHMQDSLAGTYSATRRGAYSALMTAINEQQLMSALCVVGWRA